MSTEGVINDEGRDASLSVRDKVVLVTGASSGLGAEFVSHLAAAGSRVAALARRGDRLDGLAAASPPGSVLPLECDVTDADAVDQALERVVEWGGHLDGLVCGAGTTVVRPAIEETVEEFRTVLEVNLVGAFTCARGAARSMTARRRGSVVLIGSALGLVGSRSIPQAGYVASKGALHALGRELATQWASDGVRVNTLAPGWFESELTQDMFASESGQAYIRRTVPLARGGRSKELSGALQFLLSDASSYMTGQVVVVDGGWTCV